jgi:hypothetical protein
MIDPTYADRLRETIARKIKLRGVFTSQGLIEDNEREIRKAQDALRCPRTQGPLRGIALPTCHGIPGRQPMPQRPGWPAGPHWPRHAALSRARSPLARRSGLPRPAK